VAMVIASTFGIGFWKVGGKCGSLFDWVDTFWGMGGFLPERISLDVLLTPLE